PGGDLHTASLPSSPCLAPFTEGGCCNAEIPPASLVVGREHGRFSVAGKRFLPPSFVLVEQSEIVERHGPLRGSRGGGPIGSLCAGDVAILAQLHPFAIELLSE